MIKYNIRRLPELIKPIFEEVTGYPFIFNNTIPPLFPHSFVLLAFKYTPLQYLLQKTLGLNYKYLNLK